MTTGQMPFKGTDTFSILSALALETPPRPCELHDDVPRALSDLVMRLLAKKPQERPKSAQVVVKALEKIADQHSADKTARLVPRAQDAKGAATRAKGVRAPAGRVAKKRLPWPWLVGAAAALAAVIAGIVLFWPTPHGLVRMESDDPSIEIVFDKTGPTIKGADKEPIALRAGEHGLLVKHGDFSFETDKFILKKGQTITLKVELLPGKVQLVQDGKVLGSLDIPLAPRFTNSLGMEFVLVPKGKSWLGGGGGRPGDRAVEIAHDFYLGKYEVTQEEWQKLTGVNPNSFKAVAGVPKEDQKRFPVENVSWDDAKAFLTKLNARTKEAGWVYRLPKEAEWEYACRGGPLSDKFESAFDFYLEKPSNQLLPEQANMGKALQRTCKVGSYKPNRLGLYDMHGNVWEWCQDEMPGDPKDPKAASLRVFRGGCWTDVAAWGRAAGRNAGAPSFRFGNLGVRLARIPVGKEIVKIAADEKKPPAAAEGKLAPGFTNRLGMEFVLIPKGKSWLGGSGGRPGDREVEIARDFYLGKYEVTQEEWEKLTGVNASIFKAVPGVAREDQKRFPVENVSWDDAQAFVERLNKRLKEPGWVYRLPKAGEWEYACRGRAWR